MAKNLIVYAKNNGDTSKGIREEVTTELSNTQVELMYLRLGYTEVYIVEGTIKQLGRNLAYLNRQYNV
jgi:hypothetical protein